MIHHFNIQIDTDEATSEELEDAIRMALDALLMPNGDTLYVEDLVVERRDAIAGKEGKP